MTTAALFVIVAGVASALRLVVREVTPAPADIPLGTLAVNLAGAFALGVVAGWTPPVGTVVAAAGLGALTTFSTLSAEVVDDWSTSRAAAAGYLGVTLVGGVALAWLGLQIGG